MPTGYDTRQGGRDSFASSGPQIAQINAPNASGESRGVQRVGGDAAAGGTDVQITRGPVLSDAGDLGNFFNQMLQPYVERKQQEQFFQGFTRAQSGEALDELAKSSKGVVGQLFGGTSLAQGAEFYGAMKQVDDWTSSNLDNIDQLKQMDPDQLAHHLAQTSRSMMTKDPFVNQMVQKQLVEKMGPLVDTVAKKRYEWQQDEARQTMHDSLDSAATSLQKSAVAAASVSDPSDPAVSAGTASLNSFVGMMQQPHGMSEDTYRKTLTNSMVSFAQNGNFYAFNALMNHGIMGVLDDTDQKKVQDAYDRYKGQTFEQAKGNHVQELLQVQLDVSKRKKSPLEAVAAVDAINAKITAETGITERAYNSEYLNKTGGDVIGMLASDAHRDEERAYQEKVYQAHQRDEEARKMREDAENFGAASTALSLGHPTDYIMKGGKSDALDKAWVAAFNSGNLGPIVNAFTNEGTTNGNIARMMQSNVTAGGGVSFTAQVKKGYQMWDSMMQANPAAAAAYFGGQQSRLLFMKQQITDGITPEQAYSRAFADTDKARFTGANLRPDDRKETEKAIAAQVSGSNSYKLLSWFGFQKRQMGDSATTLMTRLMTESAANYQRNSNMPPDKVAEMAAGTIRGNNQFEFYGSNMAWSNAAGTKKAHELVGLPELKFGETLHSLINEHLGSVGSKIDADGSYDMDRVPVNGGFVLMVHPHDPDHPQPILITSQEIKARAAKDARGDLDKARAKAAHPQGDPALNNPGYKL